MANPIDPNAHEVETANDRLLERASTGRAQGANLSSIAVPKNASYTTDGDLNFRGAQYGAVVGRVEVCDERLGFSERTFYIGPGYINGVEIFRDNPSIPEEDQFEVFGWSSPIAKLFYTRNSTHESFDKQGRLNCRIRAASRRVFERDEVATIAAIDEDRFVDQDRPPFTKPGTPVPENIADDDSSTPDHALPDASVDLAESDPLLGELVLKRRLQKAKTGTLETQLETLQPHQYDRVVEAWNSSQVIQGGPGTGKTVVLAHRAAFLLLEPVSPHEQRNGQSIRGLETGQIAIIGPTAAYVDHVAPAIESLLRGTQFMNRIQLLSIDDLIDELVADSPILVDASVSERKKTSFRHPQIVPYLVESANEFGNAVANDTWPEGFPKRPTNWTPKLELEFTYRFFVHLVDKEARSFEFPKWKALRNHPEMKWIIAGLTAALQARFGRANRFSRVGHVCVDEAQDLGSIEWAIMQLLYRKAGWTILGDLNQRTITHTSYKTWNDLVATFPARSRPKIIDFDLGFRSTSAIMDLCRSIREPNAKVRKKQVIEGGRIPILHTTPPEKQAEKLVELIEDVLLDGSLVVVTPGDLSAKYKHEFERVGISQLGEMSWELPGGTGLTFTTGSPEQLRSLEYDNAIFVEPMQYLRPKADVFDTAESLFEKLERNKSKLFIGFSRANRELHIIDEYFDRELLQYVERAEK